MPRPRPPHLHRETTRHGKAVWYVRVGKGPRIRLRAEYGTPEFKAEYQAAISGTPRPNKGAPPPERWLGCSPDTERLLHGLISRQPRADSAKTSFCMCIATAGEKPFARITPKRSWRGRERRAKTPSQARNFLDAMRGLFSGRAGEDVKADPTVGVENPPRKKGDGFMPWTEEHVAAYERRWPIGTRQRVWLDVLLYTGLRRGDAVRFGRPHVRDGVGTIKTEKSG